MVEHQYVYEWKPVTEGGAFEIKLYVDPGCTANQHVVRTYGVESTTDPCALAAPDTVYLELNTSSAPIPWGHDYYYSETCTHFDTCDLDMPYGLTRVTLTDAQRTGFLPPVGTASLHPYFGEVQANLAAIVEGAAAYYSGHTPGSCAFPPTQGLTPAEGTCCASLGGPDNNHDNLCDTDLTRWQEPGWQVVGLAIESTHVFTYRYQTVSTDQGPLFKAWAHSDIDCDTVQSTFVRFARPVEGAAGCEAESLPGMFVDREYE